MSLRVVFMGTPDFAVPTLSEIIGQGHEVVAVYTRAPKPAGRGMAEQKTPVHRLAEPRADGERVEKGGRHARAGRRGGLGGQPAVLHRAGERVELRAKAVLIADGGFHANADMLRQHIGPNPERIVPRNAGLATGDGIRIVRVGRPTWSQPRSGS